MELTRDDFQNQNGKYNLKWLTSSRIQVKNLKACISNYYSQGKKILPT